MSILAPMSGVPVALQAAGTTTGNGNVVTPPPSFRNHTITITGSSGVASGAVQVETSDDPNYAGTWVAQGSPISVVASSMVDKELSGVFVAIRARYSTDVTMGTAGVNYTGAKSY